MSEEVQEGANLPTFSAQCLVGSLPGQPLFTGHQCAFVCYDELAFVKIPQRLDRASFGGREESAQAVLAAVPVQLGSQGHSEHKNTNKWNKKIYILLNKVGF